MERKPKTVRIFLPTGDPKGIKVAEVTTRVVRLTEVPKLSLSKYFTTSESMSMGVCILFNKKQLLRHAKKDVYVSQISSAYRELAMQKSVGLDWDTVLFVTSINHTLSKEHCVCLEGRIIEKISKNPQYNLLSSEHLEVELPISKLVQSDCDEVLGTLDDLLVVMNYSLFSEDAIEDATIVEGTVSNKEAVKTVEVKEPTPKTEVKPEIESKPKQDDKPLSEKAFYYKSKNKDLFAIAVFDKLTTEFVVAEGSTASSSVTDALARNFPQYVELRNELIEQGRLSLSVEGDKFIFTEDVKFRSPSAASSVILGASCNAYDAWEDENGNKLGEVYKARTNSFDLNLPNKNDDGKKLVYFKPTKREMPTISAYFSGHAMVVQKDSMCRYDNIPSIQEDVLQKKNELIDKGILKPKTNESGVKYYVFTSDYKFTSLAIASLVVSGGSYNGWNKWVDANGKRLSKQKKYHQKKHSAKD